MEMFKMRLSRLLPVSLFIAVPLFGAVIDISTGVAAWTASGPNVAGTVAAVSMGATPNSVWQAAPAGSEWIGATGTDGALSTTTGLPGTYVFTFTFNTAALGGSLTYQIGADNQGSVVVELDGVPVNSFNHPGNALTDAGSGAQGCAFLPPGSNLCNPPATSQGFVGPGTVNWGPGGAGVITIRATVINSVPPDPSPVGFLLAGEADYVPSVDGPEPGTFALVGAGLVLVAIRRARARS